MREPVRELGAQHLLPRGLHPRQIGKQASQHRVRPVAGVAALDAFGPKQRLIGFSLRRPLGIGRRQQVHRARRAQRAGPLGFFARPDRRGWHFGVLRRIRGRAPPECALLARCAALPAALPLLARCRGGPTVVERTVEPLDVPFEQRLLDRFVDAQRGREQAIEEHRLARQCKPGEMTQGAVDDGVGADVEEFQIDIPDQALQLKKALRMPQGDMQDLVRHKAGLLGKRQRRKGGTVIQGQTIGGHERRVLAGCPVGVLHPERKAPRGRRKFDQALDRARPPVPAARLISGHHDPYARAPGRSAGRRDCPGSHPPRPLRAPFA